MDSANTTAIDFDSYGSSAWALVQTGNNGAIYAQTLTRIESEGGAVFRFHGACCLSVCAKPFELTYERTRLARIGTNVRVFGTLTVPTEVGATVMSTYTIDSDDATPFSSANVPSSLIREVDGQLFFDSGTLSDDDHVLVINVTRASNGAPYLLDYIRYTATTLPEPSSSSSPPAGPTGTVTPSPGGSSKSNVGPIVGGVVGGVVGLLLIALGVFLFFRYFRHRLSLAGRQKGGKGASPNSIPLPLLPFLPGRKS